MIEYKVTWHRDGWADTTWSKTRTFTRRADAEAFRAKLEGDARPDLGRVRVQLHHRQVEAWAEGWPA
jgi:hypothetical protein